MKSIKIIFIALATLWATCLSAQDKTFTRQDTLRGSITAERAWWDLTYYHLDMKVNPKTQTINGQNTVQYKVLKSGNIMQIDLQEPMNISKVEQAGKALAFRREGNAFFIEMPGNQTVGAVKELTIHYGGQPTVAVNPPWDGGVTWAQDLNGNHFIATSCQGDGASMWWPCKDHMYDEPDSMLISVNVPQDLTDISNGRLRGVTKLDDGTHTFHWFVANPISNYVINVNIGDYVHFGEKYAGEKGNLDCDYYVLRDNINDAKKHFVQVPKMLQAFEHWFGPYPFYEDGYKLVEVPYLGMEHQSSVTYGNGYQNGYRGNDLSGTGWGLKFDFIIIHESGHEWFANNITYKDIADMWVHEGFTAYSENLFLDYHYNKEASADYVIGTRANISNDRPIIGKYDVNHAGSGDMYYKGANMLHTIRNLIDDDEKWRQILRGLNKEFYHQTVTTQQIEQYMSTYSGMNLKPVFDQYLRASNIPQLALEIDKKCLKYRWKGAVKGFDMKVKLNVDGKDIWIQPTQKEQKKKFKKAVKDVKVDRNFYLNLDLKY
ncbi:MAG: M1 family metallopeptidase [Saprospiraceae bacterium]